MHGTTVKIAEYMWVEFGIDMVVYLNFRIGLRVKICILNRNTHRTGFLTVP
jgi:hypothetical protein